MTVKKTFSDLVFNDHANNPDGIQAILSLGNDLSISVVSMKNSTTQYGGLYGDASNGTYEVAVFHNDSMLPLSPWDDVLGWQTEDDLNELMASLQGRQADIAGAIAQMYNDRASTSADLELDKNHQNWENTKHGYSIKQLSSSQKWQEYFSCHDSWEMRSSG